MRRLYLIGFPLLMAFDTLAQLCFKYAGDAALPVEANTSPLELARQALDIAVATQARDEEVLARLRLGAADTVSYRLHVRGDGKRYKLNLRLDGAFDGVNHQAVFEPPAHQWADVDLPLAAFKATYRGRVVPGAPALHPEQVCQMGWMVADGQTGPFVLAIRSVECVNSP